jgi:hypothetical protein
MAREIPAVASQISGRLWAILTAQHDEFYADVIGILSAAGPVFVEQGCDQWGTLCHLLSVITREESERALLAYLEGIHQLVWQNPSEFVVLHLDRLINTLAGAHEGQFHGFLTGRTAPHIPLIYRRPICRILAAVIDQARETIGPYVPPLFARLGLDLLDQSEAGRIGHAMIILVLAKICKHYPGQPQFAVNVFEHACRSWNAADDREVVLALLLAFTALFATYADALATARDQIMEWALEKILKTPKCDREVTSAAATLLATVVMSHDLENEDEVRVWVDLIMRSFWVRPNSESLIWIADFIVFGQMKWPDVMADAIPGITVALLASDPPILANVKQTTLQFFLGQIAEIGRDDIPTLCQFNESVYARLQKNIIRLTRG